MKAKTKKRKFDRRAGIILFILAVSLLYAYIYLLPDVSDAFRRTDIIEYGSIQVRDEATCFMVRSEQVHLAGISGPVQQYALEGEQVRKGSRIMDIGQGAEVFTADSRGMVSYFIDGQESAFTPDTMRSIDMADAEALEGSAADTTGKDAVAGEPVFKIVDTDVWYVLVWIGKESIIKYEEGSAVTLIRQDSQIRGKVREIIPDGASFRVILEFDRYWLPMAKLRKFEAEIITADHKGLMLRNESITQVNGAKGVYVKDISGGYVFMPVRIITSDGNYSLVECGYYYENTDSGSKRVETVDIYDEVLRNGKPD